MNPFELAFLGLILFDCRDQELVEETLASVKVEEDRLEVMGLYEDLRRWSGRDFSISLIHWLLDDEMGAYLIIQTPGMPISFLKPEGHHFVDDEKVYSKDEAWEKAQLWASFGPWDLLKPIEDEDEN